MKFKSFKSTGKDIQVASTSGHSATITQEPISIPESLWSYAYIQGAVSAEDIIKPTEELVNEYAASMRIRHKELAAEIVDNPSVYIKQPKGNINYAKTITLFGETLKLDYIQELVAEIVAEREGK